MVSGHLIGRSREIVTRAALPMMFVLGLLIPCASAIAGDPPTEPILQLETGMHTAAIQGIGVDEQAHLLLTVSEDKTARLWSLGDGRLIRVLRPPIGIGNEGKLYSGALSPDGRIAAVAGHTGFQWNDSSSIYLFDSGTGRMLRQLPGLPDDVWKLAFSPDGGLLAAGFYSGGVHIWHATDWTPAWVDGAYGGQVYGLSFNKARELATSSYDGYLRIYDGGGHLKLPKVKAPGGARPFDVAFSPGGMQLAVGYDDNNRVDVLSGRDLRLLWSPDFKSFNDVMAYVAWSADGKTLFAGNKSADDKDKRFIRVWSDMGRGAYHDASVARNTIHGLATLPQGDVAFATHYPEWGILRRTARIDLLHTAEIGDYRGAKDKFRLSADGKEVRFDFARFGQRPAAFVLSDRHLLTDPPEKSGLISPNTSSQGMVVGHWNDDTAPTLNGVALKLYSYEPSRAVAVNGEHLLLGAEWSLRMFDKAGSQIWSVDVPGTPWAVNITPDGRLAVAACGDGTIRWYRMKDGQELLALFPDADGKRWVAWTSQGYYDASVGGGEMIGWHINRGPDKEADFFPAAQFRDRFNRPDIVALVLDTLDVDEAVRQANATSGRKAPAKVAESLPPIVKILAPSDLSSVAKSPIEVTYLVRSPTPATGLTVQVDGRPVDTAPATPMMSGPDGSVASLLVDMPQHNAVISLVAANEKALSEAAIVHIGWQGAKDWYKPDLYVLAVGVSKYKDESLNLMYPEKDAEDFVKVIQPQEGEGRLYSHVYYHDLPGEKANREEIRRGLSWLKKSTTARDIAVLFLSGHGQNDASGHYHYLPYDADLSDLDLTTIQDFEIEDFLAKVPGKVVAFLDTCFSGGLHPKGPTQPDVDKLANTLASAEKGIVVFTSSTGRQFSLERKEWNNGAFTKALVEAFKGGADYQRDRTISIAALEVYLARRVKELTGGEQSPTSAKPKTIPDFVIATVVE
jgi:WD40 repeat protein